MEILTIIVEWTMVVALLLLGAFSTVTDIRDGLIYNRMLLAFSIFAVVLDGLYYGVIVRDIFMDFLINMIIVVFIALVLFYSHAFGGGDSKLLCVMALLYPARLYVNLAGEIYTLGGTVMIAIIFGYVYLLIESIVNLVSKKNRMTKDYIGSYIWNFVKSFFTATIYISLFHLLLNIFAEKGIEIPLWIVRIACIAIAWGIGKFKVTKKWYLLIPVLVMDIILILIYKVIPFSINPENYILVIVLLVCQMTIKTNLYKEVEVENISKGMILSTISSVLMQNSRVRGLPGISTEDLRDRLTQEQADSVKRWAEGNKVRSLTIVKKIPFAIFIFAGFAIYLFFGLFGRTCG